MYIKKLFIRDFGIFRHQNILDLNKKINIIGGLNRAGKTTFLKLLRYLGYGFPKNKSFIPATNKYDVEAEIEFQNNIYNLLTKGYSNPHVSQISENESNINLDDIYSIDNFSYKQLYTLSLDQLKRIPEGASKRTEKLQSILLGAGLGELLDLQELKEEFKKNADKIGGKNGTVNVKEFKDYYQEIKRGINLRKEAKEELNIFKKHSEELEKIEDEISSLKQKIEILNYKQDRHDLLKNNYDKLDKFNKLSQELNEVEVDDLTRFASKLDSIYTKLAGLRERMKNYQNEREDLHNKKEKLLRDLENLNSNWTGEKYIDYVLNMQLDFIDKNKLEKYIDEYKNVNNELINIKEKKEELINRKDHFENKLKNLNSKINSDYQKKYIIFTGLVTIIGLITLFINWPVAFIITFFGIASSYFYFREKRERFKLLKEQKEENNEELAELKLQINKLNNKIFELEKEKGNLDSSLNKFRDYLKLNKSVQPSIIKNYFRELKVIRDKLKEWKTKENRVNKIKNELSTEFQNINSLLIKFGFGLNDNKIEIIEMGRILFAKVEKLTEWKNIRENVLSSLKSDRARKAFDFCFEQNLNNINQLWNKFYELYKNYLSKEDVEKNYNKIKIKLDSSEEKLENLKNRKQSLKDKINELETSDKLKRARKTIFKNRKKLKKKAKKYGVNLTASFILEKTYDKILNEIKDEIFSEASNYLSKITGGEYVQILPADDLKEIDFQTILSDGNKMDTTQILSRGSKEQLFLAIRLSRIKAMDNNLPVIVDDSLVNFDSIHLSNALKLIVELSKTNQVFILTCHPNLIKHIKGDKKKINYWKLKKGEFTKSSREKLIKYLR